MTADTSREAIVAARRSSARAANQPRCEDCEFFWFIDPLSGMRSYGRCRFLPTPIEKKGWDWCGQWKARTRK